MFVIRVDGKVIHRSNSRPLTELFFKAFVHIARASEERYKVEFSEQRGDGVETVIEYLSPLAEGE